MKIDRDFLFKASYASLFLITLAGSIIILIGYQKSEAFEIIKEILKFTFSIIALYELNTSDKINKIEKTFWSLAFIFTPVIIGIIYIFSSRKRVA